MAACVSRTAGGYGADSSLVHVAASSGVCSSRAFVYMSPTSFKTTFAPYMSAIVSEPYVEGCVWVSDSDERSAYGSGIRGIDQTMMTMAVPRRTTYCVPLGTASRARSSAAANRRMRVRRDSIDASRGG